MEKGIFIISLDFELMWGNMSWTPEGYGQSNVSSVRVVIDKMLHLFNQYDIHATFATVGLIMQKNGNSKDIAPSILPSYDKREISPFNNEGKLITIKDKDAGLYFGKDIVEKLKQHANIEIGTHTYSHYFCWENGQTAEQFESDTIKAIETASANGIIIKSIIFPKNEVQSKYLEICSKHGIRCYRGNAFHFFEKPKNKIHKVFLRTCRLLDSYFNLGGMTSYSEDVILNHNDEMINIPASRFLRPYSRKLSLIEPLRIKRIKNELTYAAKHHQIYHLWWHPHNFGANINKNMAILEVILNCYKNCRQKYGMESLNMGETYSYLTK